MKKIALFFLPLFLISAQIFAAKVQSGYIRPAPSAGQKKSGYVHAAPSEEQSKLKDFGNKIISLFTGK